MKKICTLNQPATRLLSLVTSHPSALRLPAAPHRTHALPPQGALARLILVLILGCSVVSMVAQPTNTWPVATNLADLRQRLTAQVTQPQFDGALWGVKVVSLDTGATLFEHNSRKLLSPASNAKLYTVALGLERLGPQHRIKTSVLAENRPNAAGELAYDLVVRPGDPTFNAKGARLFVQGACAASRGDHQRRHKADQRGSRGRQEFPPRTRVWLGLGLG